MKNIILALCIGLVTSTLLAISTDSIHADLADNLIRLHVVANSDSEEDQAVKLKVRDRIINEMSVYFREAENADECREIVLENMDKIIYFANDELMKNGFDYSAKAYFGTFDFPRKEYENITLPKGSYEAVRIVLGGGDGHNWWCVMFPPLCFVEESKGKLGDDSNKILKSNLSDESYDMITNGSGKLDVKVKFKILELFE